MGTLFRATTGPENGRRLEKETEAAVSLEGTRWTLSDLSPKDHQTYGMALSSHGVAGLRGGGERGKTRPPSTPTPPTRAIPKRIEPRGNPTPTGGVEKFWGVE